MQGSVTTWPLGKQLVAVKRIVAEPAEHDEIAQLFMPQTVIQQVMHVEPHRAATVAAATTRLTTEVCRCEYDLSEGPPMWRPEVFLSVQSGFHQSVLRNRGATASMGMSAAARKSSRRLMD